MKRKTILHTLLLAGCVTMAAQTNSPTNDGYLLRAAAMLSDENYLGCVDQLDVVDPAVLTIAQAEEAAWLRASATVHLNRAEAISLLKSFLDTYGASSHRTAARILLADCLLEDKPAEALSIYSAIDASLLASPEAASLLYHKAYATMLAGNLRDAERLFAESSRDSKWRSPSLFYLGYIAYADHRYREALDLFARCNRTTEPGLMADYYVAQIQYVEGHYNEALTAARTLLQRPSAPAGYREEAMRIAGESLFQLGNLREAIPMLRRYADSVEVPLRSTMYILGTAEFENADYGAAVKSLEAVCDGTPDAMAQSAYLFMGQALMEQDKFDAALIAFDKALKADFDRDVQEAAFYNYAVAKFGGARMPFGSSVATFEDYLRRYPDGRYAPQVQEYLVKGYLSDNNYEQALASIERMQNPAPAVTAAKQKVLYALGTRALAADRPEVAVDYLRRGADLAQWDAAVALQTNLSLGEALYRTGDYDGAVRRLTTYVNGARQNDVNLPLGHYDLGYALFAQKKYKEATSQFENFVNAPGNHSTATVADALNRIGDARLYSSDLVGAEAAFKKSFSLLPDAGDYPLYRTGVIQGYRRNNREKIATMDRLLSLFPSSSLIPDALLQTTEAYIQLGDNDSAIATYRRLVDEYPATEQGRRGYLQMALTQLNAGRRAEAVESYKAVVTAYPTSEEAGVAVDELKRIAADDGNLPALTRWLASVANAPRLDVAEADILTFEAAEKAWLTQGQPARLQAYVIEYPEGSRRAQALAYLMEEASDKGRVNDALSLATEIVEKYPDSRLAQSALLTKAQAEHSLGRGGDALRSYEALLDKASTASAASSARLGIMRVAIDLGDYPKVSQAADALLASSTTGADYRNEAIFSRALAADMLGHTADARTGWESIAQLTDDLFGAKSAYYLAQSYFDSKNTDKARRLTEQLIDSATPHTYWLARAFILLSDIYAAEGNKFEAREYLNSLRENYPGDETDIFRMIDTRLSNL